MALAAGMMLAGCSKSEDNMEENNMTEKNEQLVSSIRQHIVGTWERSGSCNSNAPLTPYDDIILRDVLTFEESDSYEIKIESNGGIVVTYQNQESYDGLWELRGAVSLNSDGMFPPYGIRITSQDVYTRGIYDRVLFSSDYSVMYLYKYTLHRFLRKK